MRRRMRRRRRRKACGSWICRGRSDWREGSLGGQESHPKKPQALSTVRGKSVFSINSGGCDQKTT
jgi:hypothetical protein